LTDKAESTIVDSRRLLLIFAASLVVNPEVSKHCHNFECFFMTAGGLDKDRIMEEEHLLVQEILKKHNVSVSQLAAQAQMADSTLYEYTGGRRKNMPLSVWRALYELTEDVRIPELIMGEVESFIVPMPKKGWQSGGPEDTLKRLIQKRRKDLECEMAILDILADGRIDEADWKAIEQYRDAHPEAVKLDAQIFHTIMSQYEEAVKRGER